MKFFKGSPEEEHNKIEKERLEYKKDKAALHRKLVQTKRFKLWFKCAKWIFLVAITYPLWSRLFVWTLRIPYPHVNKQITLNK